MFAPSTKVLVVDDMMTMRKLVMKVCRELGMTDLTEASDGALAWEAANKANPPFQLIISDWNMPNCTGLDFLKRLRADSRIGKTPFVLVTAEAEQAQVMEALKSGVSNYIVKPFTAESMKEKLEAVHQKVVAAGGK